MTSQKRLPRVRLQELLERLGPGDAIDVAAASLETGLDATTCQSVLEALVRVDLFTRMDDRVFVRRRMFGALERLDTAAADGHGKDDSRGRDDSHGRDDSSRRGVC
jgi:hypothetical protein